MPTIGHLHGFRGACAGTLGVGGGPVAADDLDAGVFGEPSGQRCHFPVRQEVYRPAGLDVDQDGAIDVALAQGKVVNAEDAGRCWLRIRQGPYQPQEGGAAGDRFEDGRQPGSGATGQHQRDHLQDSVQPFAASAVAEGEPGDLFGECGPRTRGHGAAEPAHPQLDRHRAAAHGGVGEPAVVTAVDAPGCLTAFRAGRVGRDSTGDDEDPVVPERDVLDHQAVHLREQHVSPFHVSHGRSCSQGS